MVVATGYVVTMKNLNAHYSSLFLTTFRTFIGTLVYSLILFLPATKLPSSFELLPAFTVVYLGIFVTFGAYGSHNYGVSKIPANQAAAFINLIPVLR